MSRLFDANVHCCGSFQFFFSTSMIDLAVRDDSNAYDNESSTTAERSTPYRPYDVIMYDVIAGHENIYANNSSQNWDRSVIKVSLCLSRKDASTDMQYDLPGSFITSSHLTWPKVKFSTWPFEVKMHTFRCLLTRGIRWCFEFFSIFLSSKVICRKLGFPNKQLFFVWPALGRSKCDQR